MATSTDSSVKLGLAVGAILLWAMANLWASLGDHPLYSPTEGRYARTSQVMLETGDWVVPSYRDRPRLQKPPLIHWLQCASIAAFGHGAFAVRLPSALATSLTAGLLIIVGGVMRDRVTGLIAATIFLLMPLVVGVGRLSNIDPVLMLFWNIATFSGYFALRSLAAQRSDADAGAQPVTSRTQPVGLILLFWGSTALALMAKGPVGLFPAVVVLVWGMLSGHRRAWRGMRPILGLLLATAPLAAWLLTVALRHPESWSLWLEEVFGRLRASDDPKHAEPFWFFIPVLIAGCFPATAWLALPGWHYRWSRVRSAFAESSLPAYLATAALVPFILFSGFSGKLISYVLPLTAPLALLAAMGVRQWLRPAGADSSPVSDPGAPRLPDSMGTMSIICILGFAVAAFVAVRPSALDPMSLHPSIISVARPMAWSLGVVAGLAAFAWVVWRTGRPGMGLLIIAAACNIVWTATLHFGERRVMAPLGADALLAHVHELTHGAPLFITTAGFGDPTLSFYARRNILHNDDPHLLGDPAGDSDARWVIIAESERWATLNKQVPEFTNRFEQIGHWPRPQKTWLILAEPE